MDSAVLPIRAKTRQTNEVQYAFRGSHQGFPPPRLRYRRHRSHGLCDHAGIDNPIAKRATQTTVISLFIYLLLLICKTCARLQIALSVIRIRKRIAKTASTFGSIDLSHKFSRIGCSRRLLKVSAEVVDKFQVRYNPSGDLTFQKQISLPFVVSSSYSRIKVEDSTLEVKLTLNLRDFQAADIAGAVPAI